MSFLARCKNLFGGSSKIWTAAAAATVNVPDQASFVHLTGTNTITSLTADNAGRNRLVFFYQSDSGSTTFTNNIAATPVVGQMDLGGSNIVLGPTDIIGLYVRADGTWIRAVPLSDN